MAQLTNRNFVPSTSFLHFSKESIHPRSDDLTLGRPTSSTINRAPGALGPGGGKGEGRVKDAHATSPAKIDPCKRALAGSATFHFCVTEREDLRSAFRRTFLIASFEFTGRDNVARNNDVLLVGCTRYPLLNIKIFVIILLLLKRRRVIIEIYPFSPNVLFIVYHYVNQSSLVISLISYTFTFLSLRSIFLRLDAF